MLIINLLEVTVGGSAWFCSHSCY